MVRIYPRPGKDLGLGYINMHISSKINTSRSIYLCKLGIYHTPGEDLRLGDIYIYIHYIYIRRWDISYPG